MSETDALFKYYKNKNNYRAIIQEGNSKNNYRTIIQEGNKVTMTTARIVKHDEYHIHWRLHFYWTIAVICFILAKLWWLVPLPGSNALPAYRTYPANFFDTIFLTIACVLATRSIIVGLVKSFSEGIYPASIVAFGSTGGFGAMWSCIVHRSGVRYFLIAMLVTACTLLGNALEGELQSSVQVYYKVGGSTSLSTAQCQHTSQADYLLASSAYSSGLITNTISDASSLLNTLNASQPMKSFTISVIKTALAPIQNLTFVPSAASSNVGNTKILRRHYHRPSSTTSSVTTTTVQQQQTESIIDLCLNGEEISTPGPTISNNNQNNNNNNNNDNAAGSKNNNNALINNGNMDTANNATNIITNTTTTAAAAAATKTTTTSDNSSTSSIMSSSLSSSTATEATTGSLTQSNLTIIRNTSIGNNGTALPFQLGQAYSSSEIPIKLNIFRYTTSDNREAVIMYSSVADEYKAGVYVSAIATNFTCQSHDDNVMCDEGINYTADSRVVADAMVAAIQSGDGLYGTNSGNGLSLDIVNGVNTTGKNSKLVDALFANPLCSNPDLLPSEGNVLFAYSAGRMTPLAIIWLACFVILWLIGVYLIGYSEHTWSQLATSGNLVPQIISKSPNMFEDQGLGAKPVGQEMFLDPEEGRMNFARVHRHGYTISTTEVET